MSHWAVKFIGKSPDEMGFCWGLLRAVYASEVGVELPAVEGLVRENSLFVAERKRPALIKAWKEVPAPFEFCAVGMSQVSEEKIHHVGVWTESDGGKVIHSWADDKVIAEDLRRIRAKGFKVIKFYQYLPCISPL